MAEQELAVILMSIGTLFLFILVILLLIIILRIPFAAEIRKNNKEDVKKIKEQIEKIEQ